MPPALCIKRIQRAWPPAPDVHVANRRSSRQEQFDLCAILIYFLNSVVASPDGLCFSKWVRRSNVEAEHAWVGDRYGLIFSACQVSNPVALHFVISHARSGLSTLTVTSPARNLSTQVEASRRRSRLDVRRYHSKKDNNLTVTFDQIEAYSSTSI